MKDPITMPLILTLALLLTACAEKPPEPTPKIEAYLEWREGVEERTRRLEINE